MSVAIRKHLRDFIAIILLFVLALGVAGYILSNQRFYLPSWVPGVGTSFYKVKAQFQTGQAVVPGQGQTVDIAGVKIGEVGDVELKDGRAVVEMDIQEKYKPIYRDATILLRPKTGLKDMILELNPGTQAAGELPQGGTVPVRNTLPDVNPDEILQQLDADTRAYLAVLLGAGGEAFTGSAGASQNADTADAGASTGATGNIGDTQTAAVDLREALKRFSPTNRDLEKATRLLSQRRRNLARVVHNFQLLTNEVGKTDGQLASFVDSSNANFRAIASQDSALRESLRLLPPTLQTASTTFGKADRLAIALGSSTQALRPAARALGPALVATRPFLEKTTPIIKNQLRPFARGAQGPVKDLRVAAAQLAPATPHLVNTFKVLNALLNTLAYDAPGADESYLFYNSWLNHNAASLFSTQDAHGPIRRGLFMASCSSLGVLQQIGQTNPNLQVLIDLLNAPPVSQVCPGQLTSRSGSASNNKRSRRTAPRNLSPSPPKAGSGGTGTSTTPAPQPQQGRGQQQPAPAKPNSSSGKAQASGGGSG